MMKPENGFAWLGKRKRIKANEQQRIKGLKVKMKGDIYV